MKKLFLLILIVSVTFNAIAQLEFYDEQTKSNSQYETILKSYQDKISQYPNQRGGVDPVWFEEYIIDFMEEYLYPGMSICFLKDGNVFGKNHYGFANVEESEPITDQTAYTVASISKTIMITAVMQLYFLALDSKVSISRISGWR